MEKETKSETKKVSDGKKKASGSEDAAEKKACLKFLAPEALAGAIVGRGGSRIAAMRTENKAGVQLSDRKETHPGTDCRQLTLSCETEEALLDLTTKILNIQLELISPEAQETQKNKNQWPTGESLGKDGELKICLLVPRAAGGGIIGKGGSVIKQLRESSGVKKMVISEPSCPDPAADQMVNIVGSLKACQTVIKEVSKQVQALNGEALFTTWLASTPASSSGWRGGGSDADWGWNDWNSWNSNGGWNEGWGHNGGQGQGLDTLVQVARETPRIVLEDSRGFAMNCTVPKNLTGGLIGRRGQNVQSVKERTNADISIRPIPDDPDHNILNIVGPLPNACAAYMLMMKLYLDAEESAS